MNDNIKKGLSVMYNNIGAKIKTLAKLIFIVFAILSVIVAFMFMATDEEFIFFGVLMLFVGPLVSWVTSWILYGFGEIIEKVTQIEINTRRGKGRLEAESVAEEQRKSKLDIMYEKGLLSEDEYQQAISTKI